MGRSRYKFAETNMPSAIGLLIKEMTIYDLFHGGIFMAQRMGFVKTKKVPERYPAQRLLFIKPQR